MRSGLSPYLVSRKTSDQGLLQRAQPMVCPDETLVQQFRMGGGLGIYGLQLENHHIFRPRAEISSSALLFLPLILLPLSQRTGLRETLAFIIASASIIVSNLYNVHVHTRAQKFTEKSKELFFFPFFYLSFSFFSFSFYRTSSHFSQVTFQWNLKLDFMFRKVTKFRRETTDR